MNDPALSGPFPIAPSGPTSFTIIPATSNGQKVLALCISTPHVSANFWLNHEEWEKLVEVGNAAKSGLILPSNGTGA